MAVILYAAQFAIVVVLTRYIVKRTARWFGVLSFALLSTASEFLLGLISPNGSFGALGHGLVDLLPVLQLASVGEE